VPLRQAKDYYGGILNVSRGMAKDKKNIPHECYQKAFNIFGCSYAFCSSDGKALLMKTSREDCEEIGTWYVIDIGRFYTRDALCVWTHNPSSTLFV
jgi:hypothetical protein